MLEETGLSCQLGEELEPVSYTDNRGRPKVVRYWRMEVVEGAFVENDAKYVALGIRDQSGTKYTGWIVRVLDSTGHILAEQASTPPLLKKFAADESATRDPVADP